MKINLGFRVITSQLMLRIINSYINKYAVNINFIIASKSVDNVFLPISPTTSVLLII